MMSLAQLWLISAIVCGSVTCPYHNPEFGYSVQFPKRQDTSVCIPDDPGGRHGARLLLSIGGSCERLEEPSIGVSVDYNALGWSNSEIAAKSICREGAVEQTEVKVAGLPVAECQRPYRFVKNWTDLSYIAVGSGNSGEKIVLTIGLTARTDEISKYRPLALEVLRAVKFDQTR